MENGNPRQYLVCSICEGIIEPGNTVVNLSATLAMQREEGDLAGIDGEFTVLCFPCVSLLLNKAMIERRWAVPAAEVVAAKERIAGEPDSSR